MLLAEGSVVPCNYKGYIYTLLDDPSRPTKLSMVNQLHSYVQLFMYYFM